MDRRRFLLGLAGAFAAATLMASGSKMAEALPLQPPPDLPPDPIPSRPLRQRRTWKPPRRKRRTGWFAAVAIGGRGDAATGVGATTIVPIGGAVATGVAATGVGGIGVGGSTVCTSTDGVRIKEHTSSTKRAPSRMAGLRCLIALCRAPLREDGPELRLRCCTCSRLHPRQIRPHRLGPENRFTDGPSGGRDYY